MRTTNWWFSYVTLLRCTFKWHSAHALDWVVGLRAPGCVTDSKVSAAVAPALLLAGRHSPGRCPKPCTAFLLLFNIDMSRVIGHRAKYLIPEVALMCRVSRVRHAWVCARAQELLNNSTTSCMRAHQHRNTGISLPQFA